MDERTPLTAKPRDKRASMGSSSTSVPSTPKTPGGYAKMTRTPSASGRFVDYVPLSYQSYGSTRRRRAESAMYRSTSMPVQSRRVVFYRKAPRQRTVGQQSAKLADESKKNFFHGNFTSAHGAVFTVPNKAQQLATGRPSRAPSVAPPRAGGGAHSRSNSMVRKAPPLQLDVPHASALKKPATSNLSFEMHASGTGEGPLEGAIVVKRRAASADARLRLDVEEYVPPKPEKRPQTNSSVFRVSSPDLLAVERMRDTSASRLVKPPLSPTTISKAKRALRAFEEKKVKIPNGSFNNVKEVAFDGKVLTVPDTSPIVLAKPKPAAVETSRRVHISSDVDEGVSQNSFEEDEETELSDEEDNVGWCPAMMDLLYLAAPAAVSIGFTFSMSAVPLMFVGNYFGPRELSGASVGYFITCILVFYPMIGLTFAMDTLISHEFGRDPLSPEMGLVLQRGILINLMVLAPLCFVIYHLEPFLIPLYGENVARVAQDFLHFAPLYLFPIMLFIAFNKFLNNQMMPHIPMIALTAGVILMPILQLKLTPMGVRYTMLGMAITAWFQLIVVIVMTLFKPQTRMTLGTWRIRDALDWADVKTYMRLAIPSAIFVAAEASSFDLTVLMCAQYGETDGAAWSAIMNSLFLFASFSGGLSASACANIGRCIGANQPRSAKRYVLLSILSAFIMGLIDSTVFVVFFNAIMSLFGTEGKTLQLARQVLFLIPFFHIADSVQFTFQGIFSGLGKNHLGAAILLTSLWLIGIPLCFLFGHYLGYNMFGVCVGITIGLCIEAPAMVLAASTMDYQQICDHFIECQETESFEDSEDDEEDEEDEEVEMDEEYLEEVMRRSGISLSSNNEPSEEHAENYKRLRPPRRRGRRRQVIAYEDENSD